MAPKLRLRTPPFYPLSLNQASPPRIPYTLTFARNRRPSQLQQKLNAVVRRVVGEHTYSSLASFSENSPPSSGDEDEDVSSDYGEDEPTIHHTSTYEPSISSPSSYTSLASLNPYSIDSEDLARHLSLLSPSLSGMKIRPREDRQKQDEAQLARQLDHAHAAVVAEECVALRVLRQQTQLVE
ncbi:hypothetical protein E0Z10_g9517 [Xylaria hypoxylon]|uniref:Uncharacterized protein n=1 Tax=Xylaria hypoxylon TaxID=37992 RepID=A0A4Z0Y8G5_9PEZI|nr:hypothetical protein E0Z10_g9517 [Xylaria hypoxylon]